MIRNLTWQQLALLAICLAAAFAAHKFLGVEQGMVAGFVTSIVAFLLGRGDPPAPPADPPSGGGKVIGFISSMALLAGCSQLDVKDPTDILIESCIAEAHAVHATGGSVEDAEFAFELCLHRKGVQ